MELTPQERAAKASEEITVILQKYNVQMFVNQDIKVRPLVTPTVAGVDKPKEP